MTDVLHAVGRIATLVLVVSLATTGTVAAAPAADAPPTTQDETGVDEGEIVCTASQCVFVGADADLDSDNLVVDADTGVAYFDSTGQQTNGVAAEATADGEELSTDAELCYILADSDRACLG